MMTKQLISCALVAAIPVFAGSAIPSPVPEPATVGLIAGGLVGIILLRRRRKD